MGFALAAAAQAQGADVVLVSGPVSLATPPGVKRIDVETAQEMLAACSREFKSCDLFIASAAVGDYVPEKPAPSKIKKNGKNLALSFRPNVDILQTLAGKKKKGQIVVGFAAETDEVLANARSKLKKKKLDLVVANDVSRPAAGFASDKNAVWLVDGKSKPEAIPLQAKFEVAGIILDRVSDLLTHSLPRRRSGRR